MGIKSAYIFACDWCGHEIYQQEDAFEQGWMVTGDNYLSCYNTAKDEHPYYENRIVLCPRCANVFSTWRDLFMNSHEVRISSAEDNGSNAECTISLRSYKVDNPKKGYEQFKRNLVSNGVKIDSNARVPMVGANLFEETSEDTFTTVDGC